MERKYLAIGGFILLGAIFVAGIIFSPSGFLIKPGDIHDVACIKLNTASERCEGSSTYWIENTYQSKEMCESVHDDKAKSCETYGCSCKNVE